MKWLFLTVWIVILKTKQNNKNNNIIYLPQEVLDSKLQKILINNLV